MKAEQIYVNLHVNDLNKSMSFFKEIGFEFDMNFTNEQGACLVLGTNLYSMLLTKPFFKSFVPDREVTDPRKTAGVITCFSVATRKDVDDLLKKVVAAGGKSYHEPEDYGFMYSQGFEDIDGHLWSVVSYEQKKD